MNTSAKTRNTLDHPLGFLAGILASRLASANAWVYCTRSDITRMFCHHPSRKSAVKTAELDAFIPSLIRSGLAAEVPRPGKTPSLIFRPMSREEFLWRRDRLRERLSESKDNAERQHHLREWWAIQRCGPHGASPEAAFETYPDGAEPAQPSDAGKRLAEIIEQEQIARSYAAEHGASEEIVARIRKLVDERRRLQTPLVASRTI